MAARLSDGLSDAAGAANRFTFEIKIAQLSQHDVASAYELEDAVTALLPEESTGEAAEGFSHAGVAQLK